MDREGGAGASDAFLRAVGRDPEREPELVGTAKRVAATYADELLAGYAVDVDEVLSQSVFAGHSELVIVRNVPVVTTCPHHLMLSTGLATLAFAPDEHLVCLGAVARVVAAVARRLMLQEQIGGRVAPALHKAPPPPVAPR